VVGVVGNGFVVVGVVGTGVVLVGVIVLFFVADLGVVADKGMVLVAFDEATLLCSVLCAFTAKKLILSSTIYTYIQWIEINH
jgi:hypothetical protein